MPLLLLIFLYADLEGIDNGQRPDSLFVLHILGVECVAAGVQGSGNNQAVIEGKPVAFRKPNALFMQFGGKGHHLTGGANNCQNIADFRLGHLRFAQADGSEFI
jgi:hypothetical protein